ncbi:ABC transporter ATP-binding protein [Sphaerochaeta halotolerans]|uniref:ABC transporter ATP-binding protein n=1 Tax=Sphaerochaeta halotolerans TaxID=2293840 RepID=UPI00136AAA42|nr:oligopeptide/dipeptide ABC transporter ATP-binding protein [Sphaerochaeta halotolerans]MXI87790.1 ATP-binding cassette domain-containing protein [Sphaerochaeta halotolerans]
MAERETLLEVRDLKVHFPLEKGIIFKRKVGAVRAVDGISFTVQQGEALGLVGESGCGKSTTILAISRLERITGGEVLFSGVDLASLSERDLTRERQNFQIIFQDPYSSLDPRMRAIDIVAEPMRIFVKKGLLSLSEEEIKEKALSLLERCGLSSIYANRYPHEFSGGQRQRIGIARALSLGPKLILADEPVSALDVSIQSQILNLLKDLQKEFDLTFLFIAHDLSVVEYFCDRIAVMYLGNIVEMASNKELNDNPLHPYTRALLSAVPVPDPIAAKHRKRVILKGDVPSPSAVRPGCPFYERCPKAMPRCKEVKPVLTEQGKNHQVACLLYEESSDA